MANRHVSEDDVRAFGRGRPLGFLYLCDLEEARRGGPPPSFYVPGAEGSSQLPRDDRVHDVLQQLTEGETPRRRAVGPDLLCGRALALPEGLSEGGFCSRRPRTHPHDLGQGHGSPYPDGRRDGRRCMDRWHRAWRAARIWGPACRTFWHSSGSRGRPAGGSCSRTGVAAAACFGSGSWSSSSASRAYGWRRIRCRGPAPSRLACEARGCSRGHQLAEIEAGALDEAGLGDGMGDGASLQRLILAQMSDNRATASSVRRRMGAEAMGVAPDNVPSNLMLDYVERKMPVGGQRARKLDGETSGFLRPMLGRGRSHPTAVVSHGSFGPELRAMNKRRQGIRPFQKLIPAPGCQRTSPMSRRWII